MFQTSVNVRTWNFYRGSESQKPHLLRSIGKIVEKRGPPWLSSAAANVRLSVDACANCPMDEKYYRSMWWMSRASATVDLVAEPRRDGSRRHRRGGGKAYYWPSVGQERSVARPDGRTDGQGALLVSTTASIGLRMIVSWTHCRTAACMLTLIW